MAFVTASPPRQFSPHRILVQRASCRSLCRRRPTPHAMLSEGSRAPDFTTTTTSDQSVTLSTLRPKNVVLYFSNASGPGCKSQSALFRDAHEEIVAMNALLLGVSAQDEATTKSWVTANKLPFDFVPDKKGELQKLYGVPATLGLIPGRVTYVIDGEGVVQLAFNSQFSVAEHVKEVKSTLKRINK